MCLTRPETCEAHEKRADGMRCHSRESGSPGLGRAHLTLPQQRFPEPLDSGSKPAPDMIRGPE